MTQKRKLIAGNWKMNGLLEDGKSLARQLCDAGPYPKADVVICPPATLLTSIMPLIGKSGVQIGGQDCHTAEKGAYTGDISAAMLRDLGATHVIIGHSERRAGHHESSALVSQKAIAAFQAGLIPIICVGETLAIRDAGHAEDHVCAELRASLPPETAPFVVAYEPIWAIGTGRSCHSQDIAAMHKALKETLRQRDPALAETRILYGGSVKGENAAEILSLDDVGGALVGGASIDAAAFQKIINSAP